MSKRALYLLLLAASAAQAHERPVPIDGCAVLARIVQSEVEAAAWGAPGTLPSSAQRREAGVVECLRTAETLREAYSAAMRSIGFAVGSNSLTDPRIDDCLSGNFEACGPSTAPYEPIVLNGWQAVSAVVLGAMPDGVMTDRAIFSPGTMRRSLKNALRGDRSTY